MDAALLFSVRCEYFGVSPECNGNVMATVVDV